MATDQPSVALPGEVGRAARTTADERGESRWSVGSIYGLALGALAIVYVPVPAQPSHWGLALVLLSQAEYLVGYLGAEYFLQRTSLLLLIAGGIVFLFRW